MLSIGVDAIRYEGDRTKGTGPSPYMNTVASKYTSRSAWAKVTIERLRDWGFNTIGAWSGPELYDSGLAYTIILDLATKSGADWQHGRPVDVYSPHFEKTANAIAHDVCTKHAADPRLIGYYSDNELRWGADWRGKENMLQMYLALPEGSAGRQKALEFLRARYGNDVANLNAAWATKAATFEQAGNGSGEKFAADSDAFLQQVAERYFQVSSDAIRRADNNHLYLGARFSGRPADSVLRAAIVADVISINVYDLDPRPLIEHVYAVTGRPVMVTEFAFRAIDSGLPNTRGAGPRVPNQKARAQAYRDFVIRLESLPEAVGYHWFKWSDEPKEGRFDGEDSNYGLVNEQDQPYGVLVRETKTVNAEGVRVHVQLARKANGGSRAKDDWR